MKTSFVSYQKVGMDRQTVRVNILIPSGRGYWLYFCDVESHG